ncbi:hypothetical protein [Lactococcus petauri]|uniref:hypothetical protein n=1 Tax=Lactococcus petauri TaxID=1940789 RepID=UPI003854C126
MAKKTKETETTATYTPTVWADGDTITADKLNKLEQGVANEQVGPPGEAGLSIKSLELTTTEGAITGGTVTFTDDSTAPVTVTEA